MDYYAIYRRLIERAAKSEWPSDALGLIEQLYRAAKAAEAPTASTNTGSPKLPLSVEAVRNYVFAFADAQESPTIAVNRAYELLERQLRADA